MTLANICLCDQCMAPLDIPDEERYFGPGDDDPETVTEDDIDWADYDGRDQ